MLDLNLHRLELHMRLEDSSSTIISLILSNTEMRLAWLVGSILSSYRRWSVIGLIQLPLVFWLTISWALGYRPLRLVLCFACVWAFLWMISSWTYNFRCWIQQNQWIESFNSSSRIKTELRCVRNFRLNVWIVLRPWCHFVFLLSRWKLNKKQITLESPPNLVFPIFNLLALSASFVSNWNKNKIYVNILSIVMLIFGLCIEGVSRLSTDFPFRVLCIVKFIGWDVVRTFGGLFSVTINESHFFRYELFGFCLSSGSSKWKFWGSLFCRVFNISEGWINFSIGELNEILVGIDFLFLF